MLRYFCVVLTPLVRSDIFSWGWFHYCKTVVDAQNRYNTPHQNVGFSKSVTLCCSGWCFCHYTMTSLVLSSVFKRMASSLAKCSLCSKLTQHIKVSKSVTICWCCCCCCVLCRVSESVTHSVVVVLVLVVACFYCCSTLETEFYLSRRRVQIQETYFLLVVFHSFNLRRGKFSEFLS